MAPRVNAFVLAGVAFSAFVLAALVVPGSNRRTALCIGGCYTHGPPMPMSGKVLPVSRAQAKVQALAQDFSDDPQFNQVVQLGEHSTGKAFQQYVPEQSVMGKDYENTPFKATLDSAVINNPSRNWDSLDWTKNDVRR